MALEFALTVPVFLKWTLARVGYTFIQTLEWFVCGEKWIRPWLHPAAGKTEGFLEL